MTNKKALRISIIVTIIEVAIFLLIIGIASFGKDTPFSWKILITNLVPHMTNIFLAIATSWYVIFTYFILASYEYSRKEQAEPYLRVEWTNSPEKARYVFDNYDELSKKISNDMNIIPKEVEREIRFVNLKITSCRPKKIGKVSLRIIARAEIGSRLFWVSSLGWECDNANLHNDESETITVSDLKAIPKNAAISFKISTVDYFASDSSAPVNDLAGNYQYTTNGVAELEEIAPKPQKDTEETRG